MARPQNDGKGRLGGRKKGTPNKKTQDLLEIAESLNVSPFEILLRFAAGDWKGLGYESGVREIAVKGRVIEVDQIPPDLRKSAAADACQYMYPKRKAVDLKTGDDGSPIIINFVEKK